jgi:copper chaperone CopZ
MIPPRLLLAPALFVVSGVVACSGSEVRVARPVELSVGGMTCAGCEETICSRVRELPGVVSCNASFEKSTVTVQYRPESTDEAQIADAIRSAGYEVPKRP